MNNNSINPRRWHKENTSVTLNVENFPHWVWVWGVEATLQNDPENIKAMGYEQKVVRVYFTGDNIYTGSYGDLWPAGLYDEQRNQKIDFYLPWIRRDYGPIKDGKYRSTTRLIWEWKAFSYDPYGSSHPSATTRYYDYSP